MKDIVFWSEGVRFLVRQEGAQERQVDVSVWVETLWQAMFMINDRVALHFIDKSSVTQAPQAKFFAFWNPKTRFSNGNRCPKHWNFRLRRHLNEKNMVGKNLSLKNGEKKWWEKICRWKMVRKKWWEKKSVAEKWWEKNGGEKNLSLKNGGNFSHHFDFFPPYGGKNTTLAWWCFIVVFWGWLHCFDSDFISCRTAFPIVFASASMHNEVRFNSLEEKTYSRQDSNLRSQVT